MYGEPGFFENWINGIVIAFLFLIGFFLLKFFLNSSSGKKTDQTYKKAMYKFDKLPYHTRKLVGVVSMIVYCLAIIAIFIWVES